jgi:hypothetical protein
LTGLSGHSLTLPRSARADADGISVIVHFRPIAVALTYLTIAAMLLLSSQMLAVLGVPYGSASGSALLKIHPATYLSLLMLVCWIIADGGLGPFIARSWVESPGSIAFLMATVLLLFQVIVVQKTPISSVADNFILAFALFSALTRLDRREMVSLGLAMQAYFFINSLIGYAEVIGHFHFVPLYEKGQLAFYDWRGRALLGHPLANALHTAIYIMVLALGYGPMRPTFRHLLIGFHLGAMVCFGGRTAMVLALVALLGIGLVRFVGLLAGRRFPLSSAAVGIAAATLLIVGLFVAIDLGLFDRFLMRFADDSGSAHTRLAMLSVFRDLPLSQVLLAPDQSVIHYTQLRLDLAIAIESAVIGLIAYYGGIVAGFMLLGLGAHFSELVRRFGPPALLPLLSYAVLAASATSFSTKSIEISIVTLTIFVQFHMPRLGAAPRSPRPC